MKKALFLLSLTVTLYCCSDSSNEALKGNWIKKASFEGESRSGAVSFAINEFAYVGTGCSRSINDDSYDPPKFIGYNCLKSFYKYHLQDGWTIIENEFPGEPRREAVAFVANGKAYVGLGVNSSGESLSDFYEFDPYTDTWNPTAIDMTNGPTARQGAIAFSINNIGYVGTGYGFWGDEDKTFLKDFYKYENGTWSKVDFDNKENEKTRNSTAFVINNKAYIVSGENNYNRVWEFDPSTISETFNGWTRKRDVDEKNGWENVLRTRAVSFVINSKAYLTTGRNYGLARDVWEYDPITDHWQEKTSLEAEIPSREDAVAFNLNNRGFITTGTRDDSGLDFNDTWEFNPLMEVSEYDN